MQQKYMLWEGSFHQWRHQIFFFFFWGGVKGEKCDSEGAKIQKFDFGHFFFFLLGESGGGRASEWGENAPHAPLDAATAYHDFSTKKASPGSPPGALPLDFWGTFVPSTHLKISSQLYINSKRGSKLTNNGVILDKKSKIWPFISKFWPKVKVQYCQNYPFMSQFWPLFGFCV